MKVISTEKAPGAIGPYSQGYEAGGLVLQQPNQSKGVTGGRPDLIETIARAGIAVGVDGLFIETHQNPSVAKSDGANMLPLAQLPVLLEHLTAIRSAINSFRKA